MSAPQPGHGPRETELRDFIVAEGLGQGSIASLLQGLVDRLLARGVPLSRAYIALPTISPDIRAMSVTWRRGVGLSRERVEHDRYPDAFERSPIGFMLRHDIRARRWRLSDPDGCEGFELLEEFRAHGDTDYLADLASFGGEDAPTALFGVAFSVCTDRAGGFSDDEVSS